MFIERSTGRIRVARTLFVLLGIIPCACVCGWAAVRQSSWHRRNMERTAAQVVGLPCSIGRVEHVRPGAVRLHGMRVFSATGATVITLPAVEIESSPREVRIAVTDVRCTPEVARRTRELLADWLTRPVRHPLDVVVDIANFSWEGSRFGTPGAAALGSPPAPRGLRVECVAANGDRAVRLLRTGGGPESDAADEMRVVARLTRLPHMDESESGPAPADFGAGPVLEVRGAVAEPLPTAVVMALVGLPADALPLGDESAISGSVDMARAADGWAGTGRCHIERIDLAMASRHLPHRLSGEARVDIDRFDMTRGRLTGCESRVGVSRGRVGQRLLDGLVTAVGCRPGPAYRSLAGDEVRTFDDVSATLRIADGWAELRAGPGRGAAVARVGGLSMLDEPPARAPLDRLAWLMASPGSAALPASSTAEWLLRWFPLSQSPAGSGPRPAEIPAADGRPRGPEDQAMRPGRRGEF